MTLIEFNEKWKSHLEDGHYGLAINNEKVIEYLNTKFHDLLHSSPDFCFSQIKMKFNSARVYMDNVSPETIQQIEAKINELTHE